MHIEHIALWTNDIERLKEFYTSYFGATSAPHYTNPTKGFESVFLTFDQGSRMEIMKTSRLDLTEIEPGAERVGLTHFAVRVGSEQAVDELSTRLRADGYAVLDGPRRTGDGYYECVILDPDGNRVEIAA